jgi:hypothetical protein
MAPFRDTPSVSASLKDRSTHAPGAVHRARDKLPLTAPPSRFSTSSTLNIDSLSCTSITLVFMHRSSRRVWRTPRFAHRPEASTLRVGGAITWSPRRHSNTSRPPWMAWHGQQPPDLLAWRFCFEAQRLHRLHSNRCRAPAQRWSFFSEPS